jgi:acetyl-CoA C-acetyltransferase
MERPSDIPIIVGVGQIVDHWNGDIAGEAPSPLSLIQSAIRIASDDTGLANALNHIDAVAVIRSFSDSLPRPFDPFGKPQSLAASVAENSNIEPQKLIYSTAGGEQPQALVNELCGSIASGQAQMAMIVGGEATAALKTALKQKTRLNWASNSDRDVEDRGKGTDFISAYEIANGQGLPPQTYALMEQALRGRLGLTRSAYRQRLGEICEGLSKTASKNAYAQFPGFKHATFLADATSENYPISDPYLKWNIAQDAVNQASALILTSVRQATILGIDPSKWIYLHGHSDLKEKCVSERTDLSRSKALDLALFGALDQAGLSPSDISHRDIYSCFPIVVQLAAETLGLDPTHDEMSVTGGLPFFGGPGNNYSTHAIAEMVTRLRTDRQAFGLVLANGGFMSKQSVGIYSAKPAAHWKMANNSYHQAEVDNQPAPTLINGEVDAMITAYTVRHGRHGPNHAFVVAETEQGRIMARVNPSHRATIKSLSAGVDPIGQTASFSHANGTNFLSNLNRVGADMADHFLSRDFEHVALRRDGHILEVTLNRPQAYNALFSAAHFELAEIFDAFEQDRDLWVAIITGAGDKAFCSGNDLKVTAKGGDMSMPSSGFAGLCARTNREKPVIAAVNGVAMGGGLEIVLACDLAIADPAATFALPEVKVGLFAAAGGLQRLVRQIGEKAAMELILTGRKVNADEAKDVGLINFISEPSGALVAARALAVTIAGNSPTSIRASKRVLNAVDDLGNWEAALGLSKTEIVALLKTKDAREGVTAFAQKRKPEWINE